MIDRHINSLDAEKDVIDRIKLRRDKTIVHLDRDYFDNPKALDEVYPLRDEIDRLMDVVSDICGSTTVVFLKQIYVWRS